MEKYWIRKTVPFYESVKSCKITLTEYLSGIMINIRKTRKECTGPVWGGCAKNVMKVIKNKTIYTGNGVIEDGFVRYEKTIAEVGSMQNFVSREEDEIVDVEGMYLIPGFIDVHSHGGYGLDSMDASADEIDWMVRQMAAKEGITSYFCTTMTQTSENIESAMKNIKEAAEKKCRTFQCNLRSVVLLQSMSCNPSLQCPERS